MSSYFDGTTSTSGDLTLIMRPLRSHPDIVTVAAEAEADVIGHYTRRYPTILDYSTPFFVGQGYSLGNGMWVALMNYEPDASACTDAELVLALKRTIAKVIEWRLAKYGEGYLTLKFSNGAGGQRVYRDDLANEFPPGFWNWRLKRWDLLAPLYTI